ncbi:MAG: sugar transferase [Candidatus Saccharibacteria bacterium]|nr:sugar transferase [Candidatus Saccharibacteria bacterium]
MYKHFFKRLIDIVGALLGIVILLIPFLIIALLIFATDPGPVLFKQKRFGKNKKMFKILKFRTMKVDTPDLPTDKFEDAEKYVTRMGKILRKTSLDEMPQLFNILVGQMSFIGPRPALWNQEALIALRDKTGANSVRPGLSGWAQINGRDEISEKKKAEYDGEYVKRLSFLFDCKCFFGTFIKVFKSEGVRTDKR